VNNSFIPSLLFTIVPLFIFVVFVFVIGMFIATFVKGIARWSQNNASPVRSSDARVVAKRQHVSGGSDNTSASTWYHLTFEFPDGQRQEFAVNARDYALLAEGDLGQLTWQGTRFQGFIRQANAPAVAAPAPPPEVRTCAYCGGQVPGGSVKCSACGAQWRPDRLAA